MKRRMWLIAVAVTLLAAVLLGNTFTTPTPVLQRSDSYAQRYFRQSQRLVAWDHTTSGAADVEISVDDQTSGYLERVVFSSTGDDEEWSLTITDATGASLFACTDACMTNDPCSYVCTSPVPFIGGLTVAVADADTGDNDEDITLRLYLREASP